uniref:Uncharacterized protein n=1 Tax=Romanomermis culicivorax TaxID=13658 RepID=A0A915L803_ROMCU
MGNEIRKPISCVSEFVEEKRRLFGAKGQKTNIASNSEQTPHVSPIAVAATSQKRILLYSDVYRGSSITGAKKSRAPAGTSLSNRHSYHRTIILVLDAYNSGKDCRDVVCPTFLRDKQL